MHPKCIRKELYVNPICTVWTGYMLNLVIHPFFGPILELSMIVRDGNTI